MAEKRKGTAARGAAKKAAARKKAASKGTGKKAGLEIQTSPEERFRLIQETAYLKAEREGFNSDPSDCWLVAEAEVDARLTSSR